MKEEAYMIIRYSVGSKLNQEKVWEWGKVTARKRTANEKKNNQFHEPYKVVMKKVTRDEAMVLIDGLEKVLDTNLGQIWDKGFQAKYGKRIYVSNQLGY